MIFIRAGQRPFPAPDSYLALKSTGIAATCAPRPSGASGLPGRVTRHHALTCGLMTARAQDAPTGHQLGVGHEITLRVAVAQVIGALAALALIAGLLDGTAVVYLGQPVLFLALALIRFPRTTRP